MRTDLFLVLQDLRHDPWRAALSVIVVASVVFAHLAMTALAGTLRSLSRQPDVSRNLVVVEGGVVDPSDATLAPEAVAAARALPPDQVQRVSPVIFRHLRIGERLVQLRAAPREDWQSVHHLSLNSGSWPVDPDEIVVTEGMAAIADLELEDTLSLYGSDFRVTGLTSLAGTPFAVVWLDMTQAERLFGVQRGYQLMLVEAAHGADIDVLRTQLRAAPEIGPYYDVFYEDSWTRRNVGLLNDLGQAAQAFGLLSLLAIVFGMYNATGMLLAERQHTHRVLTALGFAPVALRRQALLQAGLQGLGGYMVGFFALLAFVAGRGSMSQLYVFGWPLQFTLTPSLALTGLLLTLSLSGLGALVAAWPTATPEA
jgi:hypothetical protein